MTSSSSGAFRIDALRDLPALPQVVTDLHRLIADDGSSLEDIARSLSRDLALSAKALRLANCSFFGVPGRIVTIQAAISPPAGGGTDNASFQCAQSPVYGLGA